MNGISVNHPSVKGYGMVHDWNMVVLRTLNGKRALLVYVALLRYADEHGTCWPSQGRLAADTGMDLRGVQRAIAELREAGAVQVVAGGGGGCSAYHLVKPVAQSVDQPTVESTDGAIHRRLKAPPVDSAGQNRPLSIRDTCISTVGPTGNTEDRDFDLVDRSLDPGSPIPLPPPPLVPLVTQPRLPLPSGTQGNARQSAQDAQGCPIAVQPGPTQPDQQQGALLGQPAILALVPADAVDGTAELFRLWQHATGHTRARLDAKRSARLKRALREYGIEDCRAAITGLALSDWHMGRDPGTNGKAYNELDNVFRSAAHVERFAAAARDHADAAGKPALPAYDALTQEWQDAAGTFYAQRGNPKQHDGAPPPGSERFDPRLRPVGTATVLGEVVLVFDHAELTWRALNAAAARYAGRVLCNKYHHADVVVGLCEQNTRDTAAELRETYRRSKAAIDANSSDDAA